MLEGLGTFFRSIKTISKRISIPISISAQLKKLKSITSSFPSSQLLAMKSFGYQIPLFREAWGYNTFVVG